MSRDISDVDYTAAATAFWSNRVGMNNSRRPLKMQRFVSLADAVRFLIEDKTERRFSYSIETQSSDFSKPEVDEL